LIRREGNRVMLLDPARMAELCEYRDVGRFDHSWFPNE
jgi:hypothetical protein